MLYAVIWKELRDISRDYKTLAVIALLPLVMMPLMSMASIYVQKAQTGYAYVVDEDHGEGCVGSTCISSEEIAEIIKKTLLSHGFVILDHPGKEILDIKVVIPRGFSHNATSLNATAEIIIYQNVASSKAQEGIAAVNSVLNDLTRRLAEAKIRLLGKKAGIYVNPGSILDPLSLKPLYVNPEGQSVSYKEAFQVTLARILSFSLIFVTTPSIAYITDSIVGEKERKTFEALLATPLPRWSIILGKAVSTSLIGLVTGVSDAVGLILFFTIPSLTYGINMLSFLTPQLVGTHFLAVYLSVVASLAMILPIIIRSGSYRSAQTFSLIIIGGASTIFFMSLYADLSNLQAPLMYILYLIPYTHAVEMIRATVLNHYLNALLHVLYIMAIISALMWVSLELFSEEKIIYSRT
ncbi:MAG: ABC transporter permease [Desulfurococcales archaeon]|nr:ABC transporter permease [Desulfurococcales archaeon]